MSSNAERWSAMERSSATEWLDSHDIALEHDVSLAPYTTMKIGGPADNFVTATDARQLRTIVVWARSIDLPYFLLGGGSNMLISDAGVRGLVINNRCKSVEFVPDADADVSSSLMMCAESGAPMAGAARQSVKRGLQGLEWAVSLPGTVGGAVVGNAGAYGGEVRDTLIDVELVTADESTKCVPVEHMRYTYRSSALKRNKPLRAGFNPVVLSARFRLASGEAELLQRRAAEYLAHRRKAQPMEPSLGSTFINPPGDHAGRLIEEAGLKGTKVGGVEVSRTHANFFINPGGVGSATAADVLKLMRLVQTYVKERSGVLLQPEIQLAGDW